MTTAAKTVRVPVALVRKYQRAKSNTACVGQDWNSAERRGAQAAVDLAAQLLAEAALRQFERRGA